MCYDIHIIKQCDDCTVKEQAMSILTTVTKGDSGTSELVNEYGTVIAWLDEGTKNLMLKQGVQEKVVYSP